MSAVPAFSLPLAANDADAIRRVALAPRVAQAVWRGTELEHRTTAVRSTGWSELDAELPGGGWPEQSVVEILAAQPATFEWRLLGPALQAVTAAGGHVVLVAPPRHPHVPGLQHLGLSERHVIWIQADAPAERLWTVEQLVKSRAEARAEQIRRLQVCAQGCEGLIFLCRPDAARHESSAAPLRVHASVGIDWELRVQVLKRRGPTHEQPLALASLPGGLVSVLTPRVLRPSQLLSREVSDAVVGAAATARSRRRATLR